MPKPVVDTDIGGCLAPAGGRFELREGEGEDCDDFAPPMAACNEGGGGRFIFWWGWTMVADSSVAITIAAKVAMAPALQECDLDLACAREDYLLMRRLCFGTFVP